MSSSSSHIDAGPPKEKDWEYLHGRVDPGIEASLDLVESVDTKAPLRLEPQRQHTTLEDIKEDVSQDIIPREKTLSGIPRPTLMTTTTYLTTLPSELIDLILSFLGPIDLFNISSTCRILSERSRSDVVWVHHVQENVPGFTLNSPSPCQSYRELYMAHDPYWFLPKYKLWFSDYYLTGKLILTRYDPRRGCIEGYRLVAERPPPTFDPWELDDEVIIHSFYPSCRLHMDQPVIQFDLPPVKTWMTSKGEVIESRKWHRFNAEVSMGFNEPSRHAVYSNFLLTRSVEVRPNMNLWPPSVIPSSERVRNASQESFVGTGHKPQKRSDICTKAFRIRRWMEMSAGPHIPGLHLGEEVYTYATLEPRLYTPTEEKPYRGIFVGDYSGHGCEFLLMHQPDNEDPFDEASVIRREYETVEEWEARKKEERVFRGSLEAIKLTGDPNVPRGEHTFIADDLSSTGFVRTATESRFKGARIVKSRGHIAARMFRNDKYIESQLIMISPNKLAQYWVGFGHISFYERVNIDEFLNPANDPSPTIRETPFS